MQAGRLRRRVTIQDKVAARDSFGAEEITWTDVATVWAAVEPLSGRELIEARRAEAEITTRIRVRYRAGISPKMRVVHRGQVYDIQSVIEPETRRQEIELLCQRVLGATGWDCSHEAGILRFYRPCQAVHVATVGL